MPSALIVGSSGQDGSLLSDLLSARGYRLSGVERGTSDILDPAKVLSVVKDFQPDEIYYLAAYHHSSEEPVPDEAELLRLGHAVNCQGLVNFLEAVRIGRPSARLFYAASSQVFGDSTASLLDESAPISPANAYGITKAAGLAACRLYRRDHSLFASAGILFNHESPRRRPSFLSRRIARGAVDVHLGRSSRLTVGDLSAEADWGSAADYVEAMPMILGLDRPDDFVVATGQRRSVRDFVAAAFAELGIDWKSHVEEDPGILIKRGSSPAGDARKLARACGWRPKTSFPELVRWLVRSELESR